MHFFASWTSPMPSKTMHNIISMLVKDDCSPCKSHNLMTMHFGARYLCSNCYFCLSLTSVRLSSFITWGGLIGSFSLTFDGRFLPIATSQLPLKSTDISLSEISSVVGFTTSMPTQLSHYWMPIHYPPLVLLISLLASYCSVWPFGTRNSIASICKGFKGPMSMIFLSNASIVSDALFLSIAFQTWLGSSTSYSTSVGHIFLRFSVVEPILWPCGICS